MVKNNVVPFKAGKISFSRFVPYEAFFENKFIMSDVDGYTYASFVLSLLPINYSMFSEEEICDVRNKMMNFLNALEEDVFCQIIWKKHQYVDDIINHHIALNKRSPLQFVHNLTLNRVQKITTDKEAKRLFNISMYIVITKKISLKVKSTFFTSLETNQELFDKKFLEINNELDEIQEAARLFLSRTKFKVSIPSRQEVIDFIASQINAREIKNVKIQNNNSFDVYKTKDSLVFSDVKNNSDHIVLYNNTNKFIRVISFKMQNFPESVYPTIITKICELPFVFDVIVNIKKLSKAKEIPKIKIARNTNHSMRFGFLGNVEDPEKRVYEENAVALLEDIMSNKENLFLFEFLVVIKENSLKNLFKAVKKAVSAIGEMEGAVAYPETHANFRLFYCSFPGCGRFNNFRHRKLNTSYIVDLLPLYGPPASVSEPVLLLRNEYNTITYFNPLSDHFKNRNGIIFASSGAGKSFTLNYLIMNVLAENPVIMIIDVGGSYQKQIETFGGKYFKISPDYTINPFQTDIKGTDITVSQYWTNILEIMVKEDHASLINDEKIVIEDAIEYILEEKNYVPIIDDFIKAIDELQYNDKTITVTKEKIKRHLERWTKGLKGKILNNHESNFNPDSDFVCIDFKGLKQYPDVLEIFLLYIANLAWQKMASQKNRKKLIVFDEAWDILATRQGAILMAELYRTARKEYGAVISISQTLKDFTGSNFSADIMANLGFFYILQQGNEDFSELQRVFSLTDRQIEKIKELDMVKGQYSSLFVKTPDITFVGRLVPAPLEYWYATTDPLDYQLLDEMKKVNKSKDIHSLMLDIARKYPAGAYKTSESK